jgi:hypothetical protein
MGRRSNKVIHSFVPHETRPTQKYIHSTVSDKWCRLVRKTGSNVCSKSGLPLTVAFLVSIYVLDVNGRNKGLLAVLDEFRFTCMGHITQNSQEGKWPERLGVQKLILCLHMPAYSEGGRTT